MTRTAGPWLLPAAAACLLLAGCTTQPKNLDDLYGAWNLVRRTIINTPRGTIIEERGTPGFHKTTLTFEEGGTYTSVVIVDDQQQVETGKWSAEGSNVITMKSGNATRYGTFKVKDDELTMEFTMGFDFDGDGYPESYTVLLEYVRENQFF
ncbi:lipocalin family protein [bacterium]|nr:lipocalin family protein [bacterium]